MDKNEAINLSRNYLKKVKESNMGLFEAWLFGSYAKGTNNENSDIDIAIVFKTHGYHTFETEVKLMLLRKKEETIIEPHAFTIDEFNQNIPIVKQITEQGLRIDY